MATPTAAPQLRELTEAARHLDRALNQLQHLSDRLEGERLAAAAPPETDGDAELDFAEMLANRGALA